MSDGPGERVISVVRLPDDRYAVRNETDVSSLDASDINEMAGALLLWFNIRRRSGHYVEQEPDELIRPAGDYPDDE